MAIENWRFVFLFPFLIMTTNCDGLENSLSISVQNIKSSGEGISITIEIKNTTVNELYFISPDSPFAIGIWTIVIVDEFGAKIRIGKRFVETSGKIDWSKIEPKASANYIIYLPSDNWQVFPTFSEGDVGKIFFEYNLPNGERTNSERIAKGNFITDSYAIQDDFREAFKRLF